MTYRNKRKTVLWPGFCDIKDVERKGVGILQREESGAERKKVGITLSKSKAGAKNQWSVIYFLKKRKENLITKL